MATAYDTQFNAIRDAIFDEIINGTDDITDETASVQPQPESKKHKPPVLSLENLNEITSIVDNKDIAQVECEALFNNNIIYFMNDDYRKNLLGQDKPHLNSALKHIVSDHDVKKWYEALSVPWLALGLNGKEKFKVNADIIESDMTIYFQKIYYLNQTNLLYHYSYAKKVPDIIFYAKDKSRNWAKEYKQFILDTVMPTWVTTVKIMPIEVVNNMMKQWGSKLDILDTSGNTSQDLNQKLSHALVANEVFQNINDVSKQKIFSSILQKSLNDALISTDNQEIIIQIKDMINKVGTAQVVSGDLVVAYSKLNYDQIISANQVEKIGEYILEAGASTFSGKLKDFLGSIAKNVRENLMGAIFLTASALSLVMGIAYWDQSSDVEKVKTVYSAVGTFIGFSTTSLARGIFRVVANLTNKFFDKLLAISNAGIIASPLKFIGNATTALFGTVSQVISKIAMPVFMVASVGFLIYDMVQDAKSQSWGAFSMDLIGAIATIGAFIMSTMVFTSWSGPLSVVFAVVAGLAALVKIFFFRPKSPLEQFHDDLPKRYTNTKFKIYTIPKDVTNLTFLKFTENSKTKYVGADGGTKSKLGKHNEKNWKEPLQIMKIQDSGMVTIMCPFNTLPDTRASFLSCRGDDLCQYEMAKGPAIETETWLLLESKNSSSQFYLMAWDSRVIKVTDSQGELHLTTDNEKYESFEFTSELDWFDLNTQGSSLLTLGNLLMNSYIANKTYGLALIDNGAYIINVPSDHNILENDLEKYIKNEKDAVKYKLVDVPSDQKLSKDAVLRLSKENDSLPVIVDNGGKIYKSTMIYQENGKETYSETRALVWSSDKDANIITNVVDEFYKILYVAK